MKAMFWIVVVLVVVAAIAVPLLAKDKPAPVEVRKITPEDSEVAEEWERVTAEPDVLGVNAARLKAAKWNWQIFINAAEFVRRDPLASCLDADITAALKKVKGVSAVSHDDREVWVVQAEAGGEDLVRACAGALDALAPEIRKQLENP
ncbi:hypothetical protein ESB00_12620 [Oleiharenicola lentus]|uniref:Uncharacterized protein n=1 Tax=Oleiharenicola lentus TaxID=2508720 RepID=A0A4Q1CCM8_9BACT|nr:hypothetical protein [Oleiharenicola lentus]RXK56672.1 hypothetical protein ESB00_12620 [Oleiharenicola lentus]